MKILDMFDSKETIEKKLASLPEPTELDWSQKEGIKKAAAKATELNILRGLLEDSYAYLQECEVLAELKNDSISDFSREIEEFQQVSEILEKRWLQLVITPNPPKSVLVELRAGVGGADAALFVADIFAMYQSYCIQKKWKLKIAEDSEGSQGGFRFLSVSITGRGAWDFFRWEEGVHRVQRVPPTENRGRVHTSTITAVVLPEVEPKAINLLESDIDFEAFKGTGNGGQSVNTTDSAVRLKHLPTGIVVTCRDGKSQTQNRKTAMVVLATKISQQQLDRENAAATEERRRQLGFGDRSERRRNYDFPERTISDYLAGWKSPQLDSFMSGNMDELREKYQQQEIMKYIDSHAENKIKG